MHTYRLTTYWIYTYIYIYTHTHMQSHAYVYAEVRPHGMSCNQQTDSEQNLWLLGDNRTDYCVHQRNHHQQEGHRTTTTITTVILIIILLLVITVIITISMMMMMMMMMMMVIIIIGTSGIITTTTNVTVVAKILNQPSMDTHHHQVLHRHRQCHHWSTTAPQFHCMHHWYLLLGLVRKFASSGSDINDMVER